MRGDAVSIDERPGSSGSPTSRGKLDNHGQFSSTVAADQDCSISGSGQLQNGVMEMDAGDFELRPGGRQTRIKAEPTWRGVEAHKAVEHDLRKEDALEE